MYLEFAMLQGCYAHGERMREHDRNFAHEINDSIFDCVADRHPPNLIVESNPGLPPDPRPDHQEGVDRG